MKQAELRRTLAIAALLCLFLFVYIYWQQSARPLHALVLTYKHITTNRQSYAPKWTWRCVNQKCERHAAEGASKLTALRTCNALCGSTQLWPQPTGPVTLGSKALRFGHDRFRFERLGGDAALDAALASFNESVASLVRRRDAHRDGDLREFVVRVSVPRGADARLRLATDESYSLTLKPLDGAIVASVSAETYFGARHGLETLSQLIWWDDYEETLMVLKGATVRDGPAFPYRGLMVDTARNFMSVESLKRVIVGMAAAKLNAFHWHLSDSQSFPMVLPRVPLLARTGAYGPAQTYSPDEVRGLVEFARVRGVRTILEVDAPAHAGNGWQWGPREGLGDLAVCVNERPWSLYCGEPPCGQLNPENPHVYDVLEKIYRDLLELSGEREIFHLGGDEVNLECWAQHLQKTDSNNYTDLHDLWGDFTGKAMASLQRANAGQPIPHVVLWSSKLSKRPYLTKYLNKSHVVVQSWGASQWSDTADLLADGYKVVISHVDAWYLDCGFGRWRESGDAACDPYRPWQVVYGHRPWQHYRLDKKQILGGEVCLWTEQVDESDLDSRLWPRAAAFAERMWTDPQTDASAFGIGEDVYTRLATMRERLKARGLEPEAMWPEWCAQDPGLCS